MCKIAVDFRFVTADYFFQVIGSGAFLCFFAQQCKEKSLATCAVGEKVVHIGVAACHVAGYIPTVLRLYLYNLGIECFGNPLHIVLVFVAVESAGTVNEESAVAQGIPYAAYYFTLAHGAVLYGLCAPFFAGLHVFSEHALARARHIGQYQVEVAFKAGKCFGIIAGNGYIRVSPLGHVFRKYCGTLGNRLVRYQQVAFFHQTAQKGGFSSRRGAKVEHTVQRKHAFGCRECLLHEHRRRFFNVIHSSM